MEFCYFIQAQILCRMETDLKPCAQIGPKYSNLCIQLYSETDFLFSLYLRFSVYPCEQGNH